MNESDRASESSRGHPVVDDGDILVLAKLLIAVVVILAGAAVFGLAIRIFIVASGLWG